MKDDAERARECLARLLSDNGNPEADDEWCAWLLAKNTRLDREKLNGATAIRAILAFAQQPEGWVLVPRELTPEMLTAAMATSGMKVIDSILHMHQARGYRIDEEKFAPDNVAPLSQAWSAMLDAVPIPGEE